MLDYSVALLVNPAHEGDPKKAYAFLQSRGTLAIDEIADHMVAHGCSYDRGDIIAILVKLVSCSKELMLDGYRIRLGDLGLLFLSCKSTGATTLKDFTADNIQKVNVKFTNGSALLKLREDAEFEQTTSRAAQAAALKATKEGLTTADWTPQEDGEGGEEEEPEP